MRIGEFALTALEASGTVEFPIFARVTVEEEEHCGVSGHTAVSIQ
jgi:hypothetical protein